MASRSTQWLDWLERRVKPVVKSTYRGPLIRTAGRWRRMLKGTCVIGLTGSAGKTTTKELLHAALASRYRATKSSNSNNQLYDVARSLLSSMPWTQFCVQEIGASVPGTFAPMMALLRPQVGVVTNVGTDHIGAFRTQQAVAAEKTALIASLPADGIAVLNADDRLVMAMAAHSRARIVTYGLRSEAQFRAEVVSEAWPQRLALRVSHGSDAALVQTQLLAPYQATNVLAAMATACSLGVPLEQAAQAMGRHEPTLGRMSVYTSGRGVAVIRDDWKAPDWSLLKVLEYVAQARAARKLIVLGTISDGGGRRHLYRDAVTAALAAADRVLLVGPRAAAASRRLGSLGSDRLLSFPLAREAAQWLGAYVREGDLVLLKGSNNADHLARLVLALDLDVQCWRSHCPRRVICDRCRLISVPADP
ncbi:MAG TPA: UDP-N-acetylmuramoyl-tripeptide--D-alanyl-D-alanine ligase [Steroidobacteraceae bacterium]